MKKIEQLKLCVFRRDLAYLFGMRPASLSYILYKIPEENKYRRFELSKKSGGTRIINAPIKGLCELQRKLSDLLLDCIDEIDENGTVIGDYSHGFLRQKSIITNAKIHKNTKNVLNIDLEDFFDAFNFGRVRGFFIKNKNFALNPQIATTIAQIACYDDGLPQGSPCSPVIANLITHQLDVSLSKLAKRYNCRYSRYADDITFSTREATFPPKIMQVIEQEYQPSKLLRREISRAGFSINNRKTRIQYSDSRQDVTGLVVNKKIGVKREYIKQTRAMCQSLFANGSYYLKKGDTQEAGNLHVLEGRLNFIDSIDLYHRLNHPIELSNYYHHKMIGMETSPLLNYREATFKKFLYFKWFYLNEVPTIICEGKTDNIYLKCAIKKMKGDFPELFKDEKASSGRFQVNFFSYTKRTKFLMQLSGGTPYLSFFIAQYATNLAHFKCPSSSKPVIMVLDNDSGLDRIISECTKIRQHLRLYTKDGVIEPPKNDDQFRVLFRSCDFVHVIKNLYLVMTPLLEKDESMIEDLFDAETRNRQIRGKQFNPKDGAPISKFYGKNIFAKEVVQADYQNLNFQNFATLLTRISGIIELAQKQKN